MDDLLIPKIEIAEILLVPTSEKRFSVINRDPQPDEKNIKRNSSLKFSIVDMNSDVLNLGNIIPFDFNFYVRDKLVLEYSFSTEQIVWHLDFTGSVNKSTAFHSLELIAEAIVPSEFYFGSEENVDLKIEILESSVIVDTVEYSFIAEDTEAPSLISAFAISDFICRIVFDDSMITTGENSVLIREKYEIIRKNVLPESAVELEVVGVNPVDDSDDKIFDLVMNWRQTPGCIYEIIVRNVSDKAGNIIA